MSRLIHVLLALIVPAELKFLIGTAQRVSLSADSSNRDSRFPKITQDGKFIFFYSDNDHEDGDSSTTFADNAYHIWRHEVATGINLPLVPGQDSGTDAKFPSPSADGRVVCFHSDDPNGHTNHTGSDQTQVWISVANADNSGYGEPLQLSWSTADRRKVMSYCDVSADGKTVGFSHDSEFIGGGAPAKASYQVWSADASQAGTHLGMVLNSGAPTDARSATGITAGSDCYDPEVSGDGRFVAMRCAKKAHADGSIAAKDEAWLYSRDDNTMTLLTDFVGLECNKGSPLKEQYQEHWLPKGRNFIWEVGNTTSSTFPMTSSCNFAAAAGMRAGVGTIGVGNAAVSIDNAGRRIAYTTNFQAATAFGTNEARRTVTEANLFMYDRKLGTTRRLTLAPEDALFGEAACCEGASSSTAIATCSDTSRLQGKCCDQKPCRSGPMPGMEISGDGDTVVFGSDIDYEGTGDVPKGDLEAYLYHAPTHSITRITKTFDKNYDENYLHVSGDGTELVLESKAHFNNEDEAQDGDRDVWLVSLTYGCPDPAASNYLPDYDVEECCEYEDAEVDLFATRQRVTLTLEPLGFSGAPIAPATLRALASTASDSDFCGAWHTTLESDLSCALRVPLASVKTSYSDSTCGEWLTGGTMTMTVDLITVVDGAETPTQVEERLSAALGDSTSAIWRGGVTRFIKADAGMPSVQAIVLKPTTMEWTREAIAAGWSPPCKNKEPSYHAQARQRRKLRERASAKRKLGETHDEL